jgi:rubrerythrin
MNTKEEILFRLRELLAAEGSALQMYTELMASLKNEQMKAFFRDIANEEKQHADIVRSLISLIEGLA